MPDLGVRGGSATVGTPSPGATALAGASIISKALRTVHLGAQDWMVTQAGLDSGLLPPPATGGATVLSGTIAVPSTVTGAVE